MKVRCLYNTREALSDYPGLSRYVQDGEFTVGQEFLVMGMLLGEGRLAYLIDDGGVITASPVQLFEVTDSELDSNWHFRAYTKDDEHYPYSEATWGYHELCFDDKHYEGLVEMEEQAMLLYYRRKIEAEKRLEE